MYVMDGVAPTLMYPQLHSSFEPSDQENTATKEL